jgi:hypothetical protein
MAIDFVTLWNNHPATDDPPLIEPCVNAKGVPQHANQCAIRMSVAFTRSGISLDSYKGVFCWSGHGRQHAVRAEELGQWLEDYATFVQYADRKKKAPHRPITKFDFTGRRGIVLFIRFRSHSAVWNHIDLWDGSDMTYGSDTYFTTSEEVWFWDVA